MTRQVYEDPGDLSNDLRGGVDYVGEDCDERLQEAGFQELSGGDSLGLLNSDQLSDECAYFEELHWFQTQL